MILRGNLLFDIGTIVYAIGVLVGLAFTLTYLFSGARPWKSAVGRMFMGVGIAIVLGGGTVIYQNISGALSGQPLRVYSLADLLIRLVGYGLFTVVVGLILVTYLWEVHKPEGTSSLPLPPRGRRRFWQRPTR